MRHTEHNRKALVEREPRLTFGKEGSTATMQKKAALTLDKATLEALGKIESVAGKIKFLSAQKVERADIARTLTVVLGREVKYQWVKNVLDKEDMKKSA